MTKKTGIVSVLVVAGCLVGMMAGRLYAQETPLKALQITWGDSMVVFKAGESARLDTGAAIAKSAARWKKQGFELIFFRMGFWQFNYMDMVFNEETLAKSWYGDFVKTVRQIAEKEDLIAAAVAECHKHGMKIFGYHTIYDDGSPPEVLYGGSTPYPWQSRFIMEHPEVVVRDREGNPQYGVREMAYPLAREAMIAVFVSFMKRYDLDGAYVCLRTHSVPAKFGDQYGFNEPIVAEYQKRYGVDILTEDFDLDRWRALRGEYLTLFLKELRDALPGKEIAVSMQGGEYIGHPFGNMITDWRSWAKERIIDYLIVGHGTSDVLYPRKWSGYGYLTHVDAQIGKLPYKVFYDYLTEVHSPVKLLYFGDSRGSTLEPYTHGVMDIQLGTDMPTALNERAALKAQALKTQVTIRVNGAEEDAAYFLLDGDMRDESLWMGRGLPQMIEFLWQKPVTFSRIVMHPGGLRYRQFPSGDCSPRDFRFETWTGQSWRLLPGTDSTGRSLPNEELPANQTQWVLTTASTTTQRIRLTISASNDTGQRVSQNLPTGVPPYDRTVMIREIAFE